MPDIIFNRWTGVMIFIALLLASCQSYNRFYFVRSEGAVMPVKIRGSVASSTYIVLLPGGPSGDGLVYSSIFPVFKKQIEPFCKMVYYDQRGSGNCQGTYGKNTLTMAQLAADLKQVIGSIRAGDKMARIYLLGYSFGGALGVYYLKDVENQQDIDGFISVSGSFDRKKQKENQERLIEYLLDKWVEEGEIQGYDAMKTGFNCHDAIDVERCKKDSVETVKKVTAKIEGLEKYNRLRLSGGTISKLLGYTFFSQSNPIYSGIAESQNGEYYQEEYDNLILSSQVAGIELPVLIINGRYDTNVPFFEALDVYRNLGTPSDKKSAIILEESGHLPMVTEPDQLSTSILEFIGHHVR